MNVLVYDGPGVSQTSLSYSLSTLKTLLLPNYTVQPITPKALAVEPWAANCALLVIPGGRDLPYVSALSQSNATISNYVREGGAFLGLCAGAYYACSRVEWEIGTGQEVSGDRPLRFFNGIGRGCTYPGFQYGAEAGARATTLDVFNSQTNAEERYDGLYYNGGGEFVAADSFEDVTVLAKYAQGEAAGKTAAVHCREGKGSAILWAIHPEYPLTLEPGLSTIVNTRPELKDITGELEERRWSLMRDTIGLLGLHVLVATSISQLHPLPQLLVSSPESASSIKDMMVGLKKDSIDSEPLVLKDTVDLFHLHRNFSVLDLATKINNHREGDLEDTVRHIFVMEDGASPQPDATPAFNLSRYFSDLYNARKESNDASKGKGQRIGGILLYGEVVTSTQTLLDKNHKLTASLPVPLLSLATHQLSGRGRGSNLWLSPPGCLQFSLLFRLSLAHFPASRLVYIQYLFGLAVVEACRKPNVLGMFGDKVRLKWPNDIYALTGNGAPKKIGGILVNTSFMGGSVDVIIGCGLNVLTPSPLTSLAQLVPPGLNHSDLTLERTVATIMAVFDGMWTTFLEFKGSFEPFNDLYLNRWLHSDQQVKLMTTDPPTMVRIVGITPEHGLLRTLPEARNYLSYRGNEFIDLQPDGNSFDLMAGLIKVKT